MDADILVVKALVAAKKGGMPLFSLQREYYDMEGKSLNFRQYGFQSVEDMIRSSPGLTISRTPEGPVISVHDEKMSHVTSLVGRQRSAKKTKRKKGYGSYYGHQSSFNRRFSSCSSNDRGRNYAYKTSSQTSKPLFQKYQATVSSRNAGYQPSSSLNQPSYQHPKSLNLPHKDDGSSLSSNAVCLKQNSFDSWSDSSSLSEDLNTRKSPVPVTSKEISNFKYENKSVPSSTKYTNKSNIPFYRRTACSFGAGDVRYSKTSEIDKTSLSNNISVSSCNAATLQTSKVTDGSACEKIPSKEVVEKVVVKSQISSSSSVNAASNQKRIPHSANSFNGSDDESPPLMGIGRGRLKPKPALLETPPGGDHIIVGGNDGSTTRIAKFSEQDGLSIIVTNSVTSCNGSQDANGFDEWDDEFEPTICGYQLIGDDIALRVAEVALDCGVKKSGDNRRLGLCIEGLTIEMCCKVIQETDEISDQVLVMLGLSDILQGSTFSEMKRHTEALLNLLNSRNTLPILLTIPVLPCLRKYHPKYLSTCKAFNRWLLQLQRGLRYFWVMDVSNCLVGADDKPYSPYFFKPPGEQIEQVSNLGAKALFEAICSNMA